MRSLTPVTSERVMWVESVAAFGFDSVSTYSSSALPLTYTQSVPF